MRDRRRRAERGPCIVTVHLLSIHGSRCLASASTEDTGRRVRPDRVRRADACPGQEDAGGRAQHRRARASLPRRRRRAGSTRVAARTRFADPDGSDRTGPSSATGRDSQAPRLGNPVASHFGPSGRRLLRRVRRSRDARPCRPNASAPGRSTARRGGVRPSTAFGRLADRQARPLPRRLRPPLPPLPLQPRSISPLSQRTLILTTFDLDECLWWL
jgi:hypothetical protein